ncbi:MAG: hypothetical protein NTW04_01915 [Elusimicrobia bacterium]|nr:hypothetical protein [Elusimicrobiota bacterium]
MRIKRGEWIVLSIFLMTAILRGWTLATANESAEVSSAGNFKISITIPAFVKISHFSDFDFGSYLGAGPKAIDKSLCVYTNLPSAAYKVKADGSGIGNTFAVSNGGNSLAYRLYWNDEAVAGTDELAAGVYLGNQIGASTSSPDCGGMPNSNVKVVFAEQDLQSAPAGSYRGSATLTIAPI